MFYIGFCLASGPLNSRHVNVEPDNMLRSRSRRHILSSNSPLLNKVRIILCRGSHAYFSKHFLDPSLRLKGCIALRLASTKP